MNKWYIVEAQVRRNNIFLSRHEQSTKLTNFRAFSALQLADYFCAASASTVPPLAEVARGDRKLKLLVEWRLGAGRRATSTGRDSWADRACTPMRLKPVHGDGLYSASDLH
jgi:hypothetical protein